MEKSETSKIQIAGKGFKCQHCGHEKFMRGEAQLNTAGMTFFDLDFANRSATTLACRRCGLVHWFDRKAIG